MSQSDEEGAEDYKKGGYHPVHPGEIYNNRYRVEKKLGWGHFSTVWCCTDLLKNHIVAMKIIKSAPHYMEAARDEIVLLSQIADGDPQDNNCCVHLLDHFEHEGPNGVHMCMIFEPLGSNLLSLIKRYNYRGIPLPIVKHLCKQILIALDYTHRELSIIHTDLKPENILLVHSHKLDDVREKLKEQLQLNETDKSKQEEENKSIEQLKRLAISGSDASEGNDNVYSKINTIFYRSDIMQEIKKKKKMEKYEIKVVDFGNACWKQKHFTNNIQTRQYRSPEVILGYEYDETSDIFSFGCIVFELLTGDLLFDPHNSEDWDRDEDHIALFIELLGPISKQASLEGKWSKEIFNRKKGELKHIKQLNYWPLRSVMIKKYHTIPERADELCSFLVPCLAFDPKQRPSAGQLLQHSWLQIHEDGESLTGYEWVEKPMPGEEADMKGGSKDKEREKNKNNGNENESENGQQQENSKKNKKKNKKKSKIGSNKNQNQNGQQDGEEGNNNNNNNEQVGDSDEEQSSDDEDDDSDETDSDQEKENNNNQNHNNQNQSENGSNKDDDQVKIKNTKNMEGLDATPMNPKVVYDLDLYPVDEESEDEESDSGEEEDDSDDGSDSDDDDDDDEEEEDDDEDDEEEEDDEDQDGIDDEDEDNSEEEEDDDDEQEGNEHVINIGKKKRKANKAMKIKIINGKSQSNAGKRISSSNGKKFSSNKYNFNNKYVQNQNQNHNLINEYHDLNDGSTTQSSTITDQFSGSTSQEVDDDDDDEDDEDELNGIKGNKLKKGGKMKIRLNKQKIHKDEFDEDEDEDEEDSENESDSQDDEEDDDDDQSNKYKKLKLLNKKLNQNKTKSKKSKNPNYYSKTFKPSSAKKNQFSFFTPHKSASPSGHAITDLILNMQKMKKEQQNKERQRQKQIEKELRMLKKKKNIGDNQEESDEEEDDDDEEDDEDEEDNDNSNDNKGNKKKQQQQQKSEKQQLKDIDDFFDSISKRFNNDPIQQSYEDKKVKQTQKNRWKSKEEKILDFLLNDKLDLNDYDKNKSKSKNKKKQNKQKNNQNEEDQQQNNKNNNMNNKQIQQQKKRGRGKREKGNVKQKQFNKKQNNGNDNDEDNDEDNESSLYSDSFSSSDHSSHSSSNSSSDSDSDSNSSQSSSFISSSPSSSKQHSSSDNNNGSQSLSTKEDNLQLELKKKKKKSKKLKGIKKNEIIKTEMERINKKKEKLKKKKANYKRNKKLKKMQMESNSAVNIGGQSPQTQSVQSSSTQEQADPESIENQIKKIANLLNQLNEFNHDGHFDEETTKMLKNLGIDNERDKQ
ncbi:MAG: putative Serine/threonine-protein kinase SRPK, partial [Streblomastix strix]